MRHNKLSILVHLVWTTWDRLPLITPEIERTLHRQLETNAINQGCRIVALNGVTDHVHLLLEMPPMLIISTLVKNLKGVSSHFVNENLKPQPSFKWQASYSVFTVSRWDVDKVAQYIHHQKEHHEGDAVIDALEMPESASE